MSASPDPSSVPDLARASVRAFFAGAAVLALTTVHHVYGAIHYGTPERYHAVGIAGAALALMASGFILHRRGSGSGPSRAGFWLFWLTTGAVPVLLFGVVEGLYNHGVKVGLWAIEVPEASLRRLFPDPTYEMPNDVVFELTGILHVIPSAIAAIYLARMFKLRRGG